MKFHEVVLILATLLALDSPALAQSRPASIPPATTSLTRPDDVRSEPSVAAEPAIPRTSVRQGFYLRVNSNTGYTIMAGRGPSGSATIAGLGTGVLVAIGGTVARGFILAGMIQATNVMARFDGGPFEGVHFTLGERTINASQKVDAVASQLGALVDWYPKPSLGWHLGLSGGWGIVSLVNRADESMYYGAGVGGALFGGYDWAISHEWSMGFALFGSGSTTAHIAESEQGTDTGYRLHSLSVGLAGSLLYF